MQLDHVKHDEHKGDDARGPLHRVAEVAGVRIGAGVGHRADDDQPAHRRVKQDRQEDERPLDERQHHAQRVDAVDLFLKRRRPVEDRGVGQQVHDHVGPHRDQPGQARTGGRSGTGGGPGTRGCGNGGNGRCGRGFHEGLLPRVPACLGQEVEVETSQHCSIGGQAALTSRVRGTREHANFPGVSRGFPAQNKIATTTSRPPNLLAPRMT